VVGDTMYRLTQLPCHWSRHAGTSFSDSCKTNEQI